MERATKAALLWGVVGGFAFLVLVQGYELLTPASVDALVKLVVAVAVVVLTAAVSVTFLHRRV
ncbi:hypothetical protein ACKVMT_11050 [Halobacteriales archaeon Cl-PHB]